MLAAKIKKIDNETEEEDKQEKINRKKLSGHEIKKSKGLAIAQTFPHGLLHPLAVDEYPN